MTEQNNLVLLDMLNEIDELAFSRIGLDEEASSEFNFATIDKTKGTTRYIEYWILANAYYDSDLERFVKIDTDATSFGIQLQAKGTYPGEEELGYSNNTGINFWRNPRSLDVSKDTTLYDYTEWDEYNHIGAEYRTGDHQGEWREFGISSGWSNNFMTDSYGGVTIGGAGLELDGNGIFPFTRVSSSVYNDGTNNYYLLGLLDNAYHPNTSEWKCDNNNYGAWFFGLKYPEVSGVKDAENAKFIIMYNDMSSIDPTSAGYNIEQMNLSDWEIIFEADTENVKGMIDGTLSILGGGGTGTVVDEIIDGNMNAVTSNAVYDGMELKLDVADAFSGDYEDLDNKPTIPEEVADLTDGSDVLMQSDTSGLVKNDGTIDTNTYATTASLSDYVQKSQTTGLLKNDGTVDTNNYAVTLEKQATAETGYAHTYVIKQGGTALSPKINIPKDYLVKSASVETCTVDDVPVQGYVVGDKYIDFIVNNIDAENNNNATHIYLKVSELVDVYTADNVTLELSAGNVFSIKNGGVTYAKINSNAIGNGSNQIAAGNHTHSNYIETSQTAGLVKNDGSIDTTQYVSDISGKADVADFDTLEVTITYTNNTSETVELYVVPDNS